MKKVILALFIVLGTTQYSQAQVDFGIKAGINYNSDSFNIDSVNAVKADITDSDSKSKTGFHAGIWTRIKLPIVGFYLRPELVYTALKSEITSSGETIADYDFQKIDIPVLFGKKFLKLAHLYVGPSFQYIINGEFDVKNVDSSKLKTEDITVCIQLGGGVELGKFGIDVRWERGFSDTESSLIKNNTDSTSETFEFDTRVNQIIVGLSYKF